jgi:hypothetical protein
MAHAYSHDRIECVHLRIYALRDVIIHDSINATVFLSNCAQPEYFGEEALQLTKEGGICTDAAVSVALSRPRSLGAYHNCCEQSNYPGSYPYVGSIGYYPESGRRRQGVIHDKY